MGKLIDIGDYMPHWLSGQVECLRCGHNWVGVCHKDRRCRLECPSCGEEAGVLLLEREE